MISCQSGMGRSADSNAPLNQSSAGGVFLQPGACRRMPFREASGYTVIVYTIGESGAVVETRGLSAIEAPHPAHNCVPQPPGGIRQLGYLFRPFPISPVGVATRTDQLGHR